MTRGCVICLHGHRPMIGSMLLLARRLEREGWPTLSPRYRSMAMPFDRIVEAVAPAVSEFVSSRAGPVHFVGHSLGGLVICALLTRTRPASLGRVVMLGTPNQGSEWADLAVRLGLDHAVLGPVRPYLITRRSEADDALLGKIDNPLGVIAGDTPFRRAIPRLLPRPNDGTVSVASTRIDGMADHITLPVTHAVMPANAEVQRQTIAFLKNGEFAR